MEKSNENENNEIGEFLITKDMLLKHLETIFQLQLITPQEKDDLMKKVTEVDSMDKPYEVLILIIDIYHTALHMEDETEPEKQIGLVIALLQSLYDESFKKDSIAILDILDKTIDVLRKLKSKKVLLKNEIIFNIEAIKETFEIEKRLDIDSINVINTMLKHFSLIENKNV